MSQALQIVGALLCLTAFVLAQRQVLSTQALSYLLLNLFGSALLAVLAAIGHQWGFLLLEGVWALASFSGLVTRWRKLARHAAASDGS